MQPDPTPNPRPILAQCIRDCAAARNGHGRRWASARAEQALAAQAGGTLSAIDAACVRAARRLGEWLAGRA